MKTDTVFDLVKLTGSILTPDLVETVMEQIDPELRREIPIEGGKLLTSLAVAFAADMPPEIGFKVIRGVALGMALGARLVRASQ